MTATATTQPDPASESTRPDVDDLMRIAVTLQELKESLRALEPRFGIERALIRELDAIDGRLKEAARSAAHEVADEARLQIHLGVLDAKERLTLIEPFLHKVLGRLGRVKNDIKDFATPAKLQVMLARMDVADIVAARRRRARDELRTIERATERALDDLIDRIDQLTMDLRGQPPGRGP